MKVSIDASGTVTVPQPLREALGLTAGSEVDISLYGAGLHIIPASGTARLVEESGKLVATADTAIDDRVVFGLIDIGRC